MAWVAVNGAGIEYIYAKQPLRDNFYRDWDIQIVWRGEDTMLSDVIELPQGSIKKLIGRELTWEDEPVEIK